MAATAVGSERKDAIMDEDIENKRKRKEDSPNGDTEMASSSIMHWRVFHRLFRNKQPARMSRTAHPWHQASIPTSHKKCDHVRIAPASSAG
jgi:hypothetical protein